MFESGSVSPDGDDDEIGVTLAALAEQVAPGPATVAVLARIDPSALTGAQQVDLLKAWAAAKRSGR